MTRELLAPGAAEPPRLSESVRIEPSADGAYWLVSVEGVPVSRASGAVAATLRAMDGVTGLDELRRRFAPDQTPDAFADLVDELRADGLV